MTRGSGFWYSPQKNATFCPCCFCLIAKFATPRTVARQAPLSMNFQARILEWTAIPHLRLLGLWHWQVDS